MNELETDWWFLSLPEEWEAEQDDETIVIGDVDGVGAISLTTFQTDSGAEAREAMQALMDDLGLEVKGGREVRLAGLSGLYFESEQDGEFIRDWLLTAGKLLLAISYACDSDNSMMDREAVDDILGTLRLKESGA